MNLIYDCLHSTIRLISPAGLGATPLKVKALSHRYDLYHIIFLFYYTESKEMISESMNLKGVVYN